MRSFDRWSKPTRPITCAASTTATSILTASQQTRRPRRTQRCVWKSRIGAGQACPSSSAPANDYPSTSTELRLIFNHSPWLGFTLPGHRPAPNELAVRLDPTTGVRLVVDAHRADISVAAPIDLDMDFAAEGGEGQTPYEVLLRAAMIGNSTRFARQDGIEETWRVMQPLLDSPPPVHTYQPGSWGPSAAESLPAG